MMIVHRGLENPWNVKRLHHLRIPQWYSYFVNGGRGLHLQKARLTSDVRYKN